jgi:hypothetical protein
MKKIVILLTILPALVFTLNGQTVSNYTCKLDNGIVVKAEKCWNQVWVSQSFAPFTANDKNPVDIKLRPLGDIYSTPAYKMVAGGKEFKSQDAKPGTYTVKFTFKLSGKPGTLTFDVDNVQVKAGSKTTLSVTLYDFQIFIAEVPGSQGGLAAYTSKVTSYKNTPDDNQAMGVIAIYEKGKHDAVLASDNATSKKSGKIKPGTYDVAIVFGASGKIQKLWLENFTMKADVAYTITTNLNAGVISWNGSKDVKSIHLYPAGTSAKMGATPAPDKNSEILRIEGASLSGTCPPGTYDVMLNIKNGAKYEWKKNVVVQTGIRVALQ